MPRPYTIKEIQNIARKHGGLCLSANYINAKTPLEWKCKEGHVFCKRLSSITAGNWCPKCKEPRKNFNTKRLTIESIQVEAAKRNGFCLSTEYINNRTKLQWMCSDGHIFWMKPNSVKDANQWCPTCSGRVGHTIEKMQEVAKERGGKCLSKTYKNTSTKLKWQCAYGHIWEVRYDEIRGGSWCPICNNRLFNEFKCKYIFERLFDCLFTKNKTVLPGNLEIDGYNDELKLGFEYNGEQHYRYVNYFHKNQEDFLKRKNDDNLKKKLAIESNIALIIIPYTKSKNDEMLFNYIKEKLSEKNFVINKSFNDINFSVFYSNSQQLEEARTLAKNRGGECLSDVFNGAHEKLTWKCSKGHIWDQSLSVVKSGSWCNSCNGTPKGTIEEMIELATSFNGFCLSDEYINTTYKLKWKCQEGHIFEKEPLKIRKGKWCPKCTRKKRKKYKNTIEDLQEFAKTKNGKCLSNEYFHKDHKYEWECEKGHRWFASFGSVKNSDTWCKTCSQNERKVSYRKNKNL